MSKGVVLLLETENRGSLPESQSVDSALRLSRPTATDRPRAAHDINKSVPAIHAPTDSQSTGTVRTVPGYVPVHGTFVLYSTR